MLRVDCAVSKKLHRLDPELYGYSNDGQPAKAEKYGFIDGVCMYVVLACVG